MVWICAALLPGIPALIGTRLTIWVFVHVQRDCPQAWDCDETLLVFGFFLVMTLIAFGLLTFTGVLYRWSRRLGNA
jgi:hypothetical protein